MISRVRVTRRSLTLAAAAAALVGVPMLAGSTASAESAGTVTFSGGCGVLGSGLAGQSNPDATQVSVPSGAGVRFANRLGQAATLRLDGEAAADVPAGGTADVVFHDGPVAASMQINCLLGAPAGTVTVEVSQAPPAEPGSAPTTSPPAGNDGAGTPSRGGGGTSSGAGSSGSGSAGAESPAGGPDSWGGWQSGFAPPPPADRPDDAESRDGRAAPGRSGDRPRWGIEVEPADGGGTPGGPDTVGAESADGGLAVDQLSRTSESTPDDGPIGLLALIATVCVVGVSAGAVRALITHRANRAEWA